MIWTTRKAVERCTALSQRTECSGVGCKSCMLRWTISRSLSAGLAIITHPVLVPLGLPRPSQRVKKRCKPRRLGTYGSGVGSQTPRAPTVVDDEVCHDVVHMGSLWDGDASDGPKIVRAYHLFNQSAI